MEISSQLKGGICEVSFGYHSKLDGYATLMSGIPMLYKIPNSTKIKISLMQRGDMCANAGSE
jgi:hypothetical protein